MLCNNCNKNKATINLLKKNKGKNESFMLCEMCALEVMKLTLDDENKGLDEFLAYLNKYIDSMGSLGKNLLCDKCGTDIRDFKKNNFLGCQNCYEIFREDVLDFLTSNNLGLKHIGKEPKTISKELKILQLSILEEKLKINILKEKFEEATIIKKKILNLKEELREE